MFSWWDVIHNPCIGLLVVHMLDGMERCEFEPWLAISNLFLFFMFYYFAKWWKA